MQARTLKWEAVQVTQCPPFSTSLQQIYCLIMLSYELVTTKQTNQFPRVIFLEKLFVSRWWLWSPTPSGKDKGMVTHTSGKFHLHTILFCGGLSLYLQTGIMWGLFINWPSVLVGQWYLQNIWSFRYFSTPGDNYPKASQGKGLSSTPDKKQSLLPNRKDNYSQLWLPIMD